MYQLYINPNKQIQCCTWNDLTWKMQNKRNVSLTNTMIIQYLSKGLSVLNCNPNYLHFSLVFIKFEYNNNAAYFID